MEGKIRFDPAALQIDIHYFPRIARNLLMPLSELFPEPKCFEPDVLGTRFEPSGNRANNRFQLIHRFMTVDYAREHEDAFEYRSKRWGDTCRQIERNGERPTWCTTNCNATYQDYRNLFETITNQSFLLGEDHDDRNAFVENNIELLAKRGFDTLFLEGIPYEAQCLIDAYLAMPAESNMPAELAMVLGRHCSLVTKAKLAGIRTVGIDTQQTYLPEPDDLHEYGAKREGAMNDTAVEIIRKEQGRGKYIARVGEQHLLLSTHGIPGMGSLWRCRRSA